MAGELKDFYPVSQVSMCSQMFSDDTLDKDCDYRSWRKEIGQ